MDTLRNVMRVPVKMKNAVPGVSVEDFHKLSPFERKMLRTRMEMLRVADRDFRRYEGADMVYLRRILEEPEEEFAARLAAAKEKLEEMERAAKNPGLTSAQRASAQLPLYSQGAKVREITREGAFAAKLKGMKATPHGWSHEDLSEMYTGQKVEPSRRKYLPFTERGVVFSA